MPEDRSSIITPATCEFASDRAKKPSRAALAIIVAAAKEFSTYGLLEMRARFVAAGEHPITLEAVDRELYRRTDSLTRTGL